MSDDSIGENLTVPDRTPLRSLALQNNKTDNRYRLRTEDNLEDKENLDRASYISKSFHFDRPEDPNPSKARDYIVNKPKLSPLPSHLNSPKSVSASIKSIHLPPRQLDAYTHMPHTYTCNTQTPGSTYTKAMADLQKIVSDKEREHIRLKDEYLHLRDEFSDPLQCDQIIDHLNAELRDMTKQLHDTSATNRALVIRREEIEYNIQMSRTKCFKLDKEIQAHADIIEKSRKLLSRKEEEIAKITSRGLYQDSDSFAGQNRLRDTTSYCLKLSNDKSSNALLRQSQSKSNYKTDYLAKHHFTPVFTQHYDQEQSKPLHNDELFVRDKLSLEEKSSKIEQRHDLKDQSDEKNELDYSPSEPNFTEPYYAVQKSKIMPTETPNVNQTASGSEYKEIYRLMNKKQQLREEMTSLARQGQSENECYRLLSLNISEIDSMIDIATKIAQITDSHKYR